MNVEIKNIKKIINEYPFLLNLISKLNEADIKYGLYAGSYVSIITSNRDITDFDFLVSYNDMQKLRKIFPFAITKDYGDCLLLYIWNNNVVEFMAYPEKNINNSDYYLCLTDLSWRNISKLKYKNITINFLNPVDTIIQKAILQRWKNQWKNDINDIKELIKYVNLDLNYLIKRLKEFNKKDKAIEILKKLKIL